MPGDLWNTDDNKRPYSSGRVIMGTDEPPLPFTDDLDTGGFWAAANDGKLVICACAKCDFVLHLPKKFCHRCGSWETYWRELAPTGTLYTWTVITQQLHPGFPTPYTIVLVEIDGASGARLVGHIDGTPELRIGMPMRARFEKIEDHVTLVGWESSE